MNPIPIKPVGNKLLIEMIKKEDETSEGGVVLSNFTLSEGRIVAISDHLKNVYKVGDIVLYPDKKGIEEAYGGKIYKWLDADTNKEEIYGIRVSSIAPKDKGDNL